MNGVVATAWSAADVLLRQGLQFVVMVILARLVTPEDFGTIALLSLFTGLGTVVVDAGLSTALIQRRDVSSDDESTVFWMNLALGAAMSLGVASAAPLLASFYSRPVLEPLAWVMAANILASAFMSVQTALLTKQLNFRPILVSGLVGAVASAAAALVLAFAGAGVWALAVQSITMTVVSATVLWTIADWRPRPVFRVEAARRLFRFGGYIFLANLFDMLYLRLYTLLAGKMFGIREVGFYNRADTAQQFPVDILGTISARVLLPIFSAADAPTALHRGTSRAISTLMFINVPLLLGLGAVSGPFVEVVFGPQWHPVAPLLQILCLAGVFWPLHVINVQVLVAQGHARLVFMLEIVKKSVGIAVLVAGAVLGGLTGLAWAQVVVALVAVVVNTHYTGRFLGYGFVAQVREFLPIVAISLPATVVAHQVARSADTPALSTLLLASMSGAAVFAALVVVVRPVAVGELLSVLRREDKLPQ